MIEIEETFYASLAENRETENYQSILNISREKCALWGFCYVTLYEFRAVTIMKDDGIIDSDPIWFRLE